MFELSVVTKKLGKFDFRMNFEGKNQKSDENAGISVKTGIFCISSKIGFFNWNEIILK